MYTYNYSPKYRMKLPYYDIFPLIIILSYTKNGFYGLNFHYLPEMDRVILFKLLAPFTVNYVSKRLLRLNYIFLLRLMRSFWRFACKKYLWNHLTSRMLYIPSEHWETVMNMPVVSFKKAPTRYVYQNFRLFRIRNGIRRF